MTVDLGPAWVAVGSPAGIEIRSFVRGRDEPTVHRVFMEAFAGQWGATPMSLEDWIELRIEWEGFDPSLWLVAVQGEEVAGALSARVIEGVGWVTTLGVLPRFRGRGTGGALLERALQEFRRRGVHVAKLEVDAANDTGATRLYERAGMRVEREYLLFEKPLGEAIEAGGTSDD